VVQKMTYSYAGEIAGADLALLGKGLVVGPVHDTGGERVRGDVLHAAPESKGPPRGGQERVGGLGWAGERGLVAHGARGGEQRGRAGESGGGRGAGEGGGRVEEQRRRVRWLMRGGRLGAATADAGEIAAVGE
jgi:hypothetical protein